MQKQFTLKQPLAEEKQKLVLIENRGKWNSYRETRTGVCLKEMSDCKVKMFHVLKLRQGL